MCLVDFVGKSEENRRPREETSRIGNVAHAFFAKSHRAQRTSTIKIIKFQTIKQFLKTDVNANNNNNRLKIFKKNMFFSTLNTNMFEKNVEGVIWLMNRPTKP